MRRLLLCACLALSTVPVVDASKIVWQKLEDMIGSIDVIVLATVREVEARERNCYRYDMEVSECLAGEISTNRLTIAFYDQFTPRVSVISAASGIEYELKTGTRYVLLFQSVDPQRLVRAEPEERRDVVLKAWRENRERKTNEDK